jgi:hypothetical protein
MLNQMRLMCLAHSRPFMGSVLHSFSPPTVRLIYLPFSLSAYLYEATKDQKYLQVAELSAEFIKNHMYNGSIILDTFDLTVCGPPDSGDAAITYNSAFFIEGLAVLANVTNNATWISLYA